MKSRILLKILLSCHLGSTFGLNSRTPVLQKPRPVQSSLSNRPAKELPAYNQQPIDHRNNISLHLSSESNNDVPVSKRRPSFLTENRILLGQSAGIYLASTIALSKVGLLGEDYSNVLMFQDFGVSILTTVLALIFVKTITKLAADDVLQARDSRKIIHILSAPLFIICWPLFSDTFGARFFAAFVPFLQAVKLWLAGTSSEGDAEELANAISRSGNKEEALGGPFIYVVILFSAILLSFRDNLSGVIALSTMAAGDGMADIIGRRFGKNNKWFFSESKSIAGSAGFVIASFLCSTLLSMWLLYTNSVAITMAVPALIGKILFISVVSAMVELFPVGDDNWSVPLTAGILSYLFIQ